MLDRRIAARQPPPTCLPELRRALLDEWCNIPQDQIDNLILSMPRRSTQLGIGFVDINHTFKEHLQPAIIARSFFGSPRKPLTSQGTPSYSAHEPDAIRG
ncbi:transposable element Tc3 transposase [Trichonephila clavipes]|nr:transposable element Tc3 transposase [Trichonephila clavipes]